MKKSVEKVLQMIQEGKIFELKPDHFLNREMTIEEMKAIFDYFDAFWQYEGNPDPLKPHALLKSLSHSNGFIACRNVLQYPTMNRLFANEIVKKIGTDAFEVDVVVSSAYSAISLGYEVARIIAEDFNPEVQYIEIEKDKDDNPTIIRNRIDHSKKVLVVNELMTTMKGSTWESRKAVLTCNKEDSAPEMFPYSVVLVHRSKDFRLPDETDVIPIFHFDMTDYDPEKEVCKYCEAGSKAIKPKIGDNWEIIHGRKK